MAITTILNTDSGASSLTQINANFVDLDTTKADVLTSDQNYVSDAQLAVIANTSGTNTGDLQTRVILVSRDMTAVSGDVSYTGTGFIPTAMIAFGSISGGLNMMWGAVDSAKNYGRLIDITNQTYADGNSKFIDIQTVVNVDMQSAIVKSFDANGFTLTWTKTGTPTGTANFVILCFK
jgi:hypothetical protein